MLHTPKKLLVVANWKMTPPTLSEAKKNAIAFRAISKVYKKVPKSNVSLQVLVCPAFPLISDLKTIFAGSDAKVGSQDASFYETGSKTGEVSASVLSSIGAAYSIVGHSERRSMGDTDEIVAVKLGQILLTNMSAILCIGEDERDIDGMYLEDVKKQLKASLARMSNGDFSKLIIAYEPVWAIGKKDNVSLSGHELHQMVIFIRKTLRELFNESIASSVKILYGGSVNPVNAEDIIWNGEVDGLLIGRASFDPKSYEEICKAIVMPTLSEGKVMDRQKIRDLKDSLKIKKVDPRDPANKKPIRISKTKPAKPLNDTKSKSKKKVTKKKK